MTSAKTLPSGSRFHVRVPGSTSNLGPGFDCLGMALSLFNDFEVQSLETGTSTLVLGGQENPTKDNPFFGAFRAVGRNTGLRLPPVRVTASTAVPPGAGLGSSATAAVAGALSANHLLGNPLTQGELLHLLARQEGHPDNVTPCLLGGLTLSTTTETGIISHIYRPAELWRLLILVPDYELPTAKARKLLPDKVSLRAAVHNLSRLPLVIDALIEGDAETLGKVLDDKLHEPVRSRKIKRYKKIRAAVLEAGAPAVFISGSGPAVAAFATSERNARAVRKAMLAEVEGAKFGARVLSLRPEMAPARIAEDDA